VTKTDVKCSWIRHPKSKIPRPTVTMDELYPPRKPKYRYVFTISRSTNCC